MEGHCLYFYSIHLAKDALTSLTALLEKGLLSSDASTLPHARIHPDMKPLSYQVHAVTDLAAKLCSRLNGDEPRAFDDSLKSFADFSTRIVEVQQMLSKVDEHAVNNRDRELVPLGLRHGEIVHIPGSAYVTGFSLPNLFFHLTTAYNIMRMEGVQLGKMDFLGPFINQHVFVDK